MSMNPTRTPGRKPVWLKPYNEEANQITQECIESALLVLMQEKPFAEISITEITSRAGVSRNAYYRNYSSREDILHNVFNHAEDALLEKLIAAYPRGRSEAFRELFRTISQDSNAFRIILKAGMEQQFLAEMNRRFVGSLPGRTTEERYLKYFWLGALSNIVFRWIENGMQETPEEMAEFCTEHIRILSASQQSEVLEKGNVSERAFGSVAGCGADSQPGSR